MCRLPGTAIADLDPHNPIVEKAMQVREIMSRDVRLTRPDDSIQHAAACMRDADVGALPVGDGDHLIGVITDRDIAVRAVAAGRASDCPVAEVMSAEVRYCFEDQDIEEIASNLADEKIRRLPVVNRDKRLVGMVAVADLARHATSETTGRTVAGVSRRTLAQ